MRYFDLLNFQHLILYLFPTLLFIILFWVALANTAFKKPRVEKGRQKAAHQFAEDIGEGHGPFPLAMLLIIVGSVLWAFFYILLNGLLEVRI